MSRLVKNTLLVTAGEAAAKLSGFARDILIAGVFGVSAQLDSFMVALNVPAFFVSFLGASLTTAFVPVYFRYREQYDAEFRQQFLGNLTSCISVVFLLLGVLVFLTAAPLVKLMAPGFPPQQAASAASLVRMFSVLTLLTGVVTYLKAPLQCEERFVWPVLGDVSNNILVLLSAWWFSCWWGINGLALAFILGSVVQLVLQVFSYCRYGGKFSVRIDFAEPGLLEVVRLSLPLYIGMLSANISLVIARAMASGLSSGSISALTYADKVRSLPINVFGFALVTVLFPVLSRMAVLEDREKMADLLGQVSRAVLIICGYIVNAAWLLALPITVVLFQRGNFDHEAAIMTAGALRYLALGIPAVVLGTILLRVYHAHRDTLTPVLIGFVGVGINIALNFLLLGPLAHEGIALATTASNWFWCILLGLILYRRYRLPALPLTTGSLTFLGKLALVNLIAFAAAGWVIELLAGSSSLVAAAAAISVISLFTLLGIAVFGLHDALKLDGPLLRLKKRFK